MGTLVEELVKRLVKKLVGEKYQQKTSNFQIYTNTALPSRVGRFAKRGREICHPV
jgi:ribosomal protein S17E